MDNIVFKGKKNPKIESLCDDEVLKFYLGKDDLSDPDTFESFVKSCEQMVRKDERYSNYIGFLKECGFNKDAFQSDIDNTKFPDVKIEMHHGPMFNLYDICAIIIDHTLNSGDKVCTFDIADKVLTEHECHNIQLIPLTKTNHQLCHDGKIFAHINQTTGGNIVQFIKNYKKGLRREHLYTLEEYIKMCKKFDATDNDYLCVKKVLKKIKKAND